MMDIEMLARECGRTRAGACRDKSLSVAVAYLARDVAARRARRGAHLQRERQDLDGGFGAGAVAHGIVRLQPHRDNERILPPDQRPALPPPAGVGRAAREVLGVRRRVGQEPRDGQQAGLVFHGQPRQGRRVARAAPHARRDCRREQPAAGARFRRGMGRDGGRGGQDLPHAAHGRGQDAAAGPV